MRVSLRLKGRLPVFLHLKQLGIFLCLLVLSAAVCAQAAVVRGTVTDRLGSVVRGARVNLVQNGKVISTIQSGADGSYELLSAATGRFVVSAIGTGFGMSLSPEFYSGALDVVNQNLVLKPANVAEDITVTATGVPTPQAQLTGTLDVMHGDDLTTRAGIVDDLRLMTGVNAVQTGQIGGVTSLFVRGGSSSANKVLFDGMPANDLGGYFDFGTVSTTGLAQVEVARGPVTVIYGADAGASALSFETPRGVTAKPVLNYSGDGGNFHAFRNEVTLGGTHNKLDYFLGYSRFDIANGVALDKYHDGTAAANLGYTQGAVQARFTLRYSVSATGLPGSTAFYGLSENAKQGDQDMYSTGVIEHRTRGDWHNLVRYGIMHKREQDTPFGQVGTPVVSSYIDANGNTVTYTTYYGNTVTINGANGTSGTGQAAIYGIGKSDAVNEKNEFAYQTDYRFSPHHAVYGSFRYDDEKGVYVNPSNFLFQNLERTNFEYSLQLQGDIHTRVFYSLGGGVVKNHTFGLEAVPQLGLAYYPVRPGTGRFHGTKLRFNFTKGVQEVPIAKELNSLRNVLTNYGYGALIGQDHIPSINAQSSRAYEGGIDQNIWSQKLVAKVTFFHNEYGNQVEAISPNALGANYNLPASVVSVLNNSYAYAYVNTLAYRALGAEASLEFRPAANFVIRGGYTYLDTVTQKSYVDSALTPDYNPAYPNTRIGANDPLVGARQFRQPPHSGYLVAQFSHGKWAQAAKIAMVSRSDDSTYLEYSDFYGGNSLLLPNRNLDHGFAKIDLNETYQASARFAIFAQLDNVLGQQEMSPIGYTSLPSTLRMGIKARFGGR
jgi:iron complex outermembrane receptor protein/vitamin B12 transporter